MNKKICHITTAHPWDDIRIFKKECVSLQKEGYDVHLIASVDGSFKDSGVQIHGIGSGKGRGRFYRMINLADKALKTAMKINADVYHLHDPELLRIGLSLKRRTSASVLYDSHEDLPRQILGKHYIPDLIRPVFAKLAETLENAMVRRLDGLIAATPHIAERFSSVAGRVKVVQNFPMLHEFVSLVPNFDNRTRPQLCYAGGLTEIRGTREMLMILGRIPNLTLAIAGEPGDEFSRSLLRQYHSHPNLHLLGSVSRSDVQELYRTSYIGLALLHPNENYIMSYPIKLFEYMASALPVIASDFPLWRSIVEDADCGYCVNPFDQDEIVKVIQELLADPVRAREMGENGRKAVLEKYNWTLEEKKLIDFYKDLK